MYRTGLIVSIGSLYLLRIRASSAKEEDLQAAETTQGLLGA